MRSADHVPTGHGGGNGQKFSVAELDFDAVGNEVSSHLGFPDALLRQVYGDARVDTETTVNDTRRVFKDQPSLIRTTKYVGIN